MVDADRVVSDDLQTWVKTGSNLSAEVLGMAGQDRVELGTGRDQLVGGSRRVVVVDDHVIVPRRALQRRVGQTAGDPQPGLGHFLRMQVS